MSTKNTDKDLHLKLRFKRILFALGYYSPLEVELSHYGDDGKGRHKRASLTDLDVLGIKVDPVLTVHRVVADCKSGKVSDPNRLFWLRGVSDYFGANDAYFLRPVIGDHARAIAPKLGLRALDEKELRALELNLRVDDIPIPLADPDFYEMRNSLWGISVQKGQDITSDQLLRKGVYAYLTYLYWYIDPHRNLFNLISRVSKVAHLLRNNNKEDVLLAYAALQRFVLCLIEIGAYVYSRGISEIHQNVRNYIFGGPLGIKEREQLFKLVEQLTGHKEELDPNYLSEVVELLNRFIKNPVEASNVLLYMDATYDWCELMGNTDLTGVFGMSTNTGSIVLARDACICFARATGLREDLFPGLMSL